MKIVEVVAAVIENDEEILCTQRNQNKFEYLSYKFEFPGGKLEPGETQHGALLREIKEELDYEIEIREFLMTVVHQYPDFKLVMHSFACFANNRSYSLKEHAAGVWLAKEDLMTLDWAAADIPIAKYLMRKK